MMINDNINAKNKDKNKKGISVLYVIFILSILLAIGFGISGILVRQMKMLGEIGYSTVAFYAADSCIEKVLMDWGGDPSNISIALTNGAICQVFVTPKGGNCSAPTFCLKSIGSYQKVKRAIEVSY